MGYTFEVNGEPFFRPHVGAGCWCGRPCTRKQADILAALAERVAGSAAGPSKFFLRGNRGGGKSLLVRRGFLHRMALAFPGIRYVVVRRNMPDLTMNHLDYLTEEMQAFGGEYVKSPLPTCRYPRRDGKQSLGFYRQCEEERDVEKIVGAEAAILFVDEAPQIQWQFLRTISPSIRVAVGHPYRTLEIYSGNPIGESIDEMDRHFIDKDITDDPTYDPGDWQHISLRREDNGSIDPKEYLKQFQGLSLQYRKAWLDGERVEDRTLFDVRKVIDADLMVNFLDGTPRPQPLPAEMLGRPYHVIQELPKVSGVPVLQVPWIQVHRAFDMGFYPDPAAAEWFAVVGKRVIAFSEGTWFKTIPQDLAKKMVEQHTELVGDVPCAMTYIDPHCNIQDGRVTVMDHLELNGVPCEASVSDRILYADAINGLLGEEVEPGVPRFQIYEPGCPMLAKYLPKMRWDEKQPRKMADHKFDHWVCALAYFAISSGVLAVSAKEDTAHEPVWMQWMRESNQRPVYRGNPRRMRA